ncbi:MAG: hypothetical protein M1383_01770 [Patescibacteria group bacterium]|nr:hypothetical protein [Patescibacteria group bacterium]
MIIGPDRGKDGESKFGFTVGQRVQVTEDQHFKDWHGHVRTFDGSLIAVDLDEPPAGHQQNGQWFRPDKLRKAPLRVIIKDRGCWSMQFSLNHPPHNGQELPLKTAGFVPGSMYEGVYRLTKVGAPPANLKAVGFQWEVQLEEVRKLKEGEQPISVGYYD